MMSFQGMVAQHVEERGPRRDCELSFDAVDDHRYRHPVGYGKRPRCVVLLRAIEVTPAVHREVEHSSEYVSRQNILATCQSASGFYWMPP
jgi:hypothetical protein